MNPYKQKNVATLRFTKEIEQAYPHIRTMDEALARLQRFKRKNQHYPTRTIQITTDKISSDTIRFQIEIGQKQDEKASHRSTTHIVGELRLNDGLVIRALIGVVDSNQHQLTTLLTSFVLTLLSVFLCYPVIAFNAPSGRWAYLILLAISLMVLLMLGISQINFIIPRNDILRRLQSIFEARKH